MRRHSGDLGVWLAIGSNNCDGSSTLGRSQSRGVAGRRSGVCMEHLMGGLEKEGRGARNALPTRRSAEPCSERMIGAAERTPCRARYAIEIAAFWRLLAHH